MDAGHAACTRDTEAQAGLPLKGRAANVPGLPNAARDLGGRPLVLVDDVATSGATLDEAACVPQAPRRGQRDGGGRRPGGKELRMGRLHRPTCLAALALLLTVPFLLPHHYNPIPTFFQEWTAALLSLVALTWLLRPAPDGRVEFPEIGLLPLGLLALALLQLVLPSGAIPGARADARPHPSGPL